MDTTKTRRANIGPVVATARLTHPTDGNVTLRIGKPRRDRGAWVCWFELAARKQSEFGCAFGEDAVQAMFLVHQAIRNAVEGGGYTTFGGWPAEVSFPRFVVGFDLDMLRTNEKLLEKEMTRYVRKMAARHRRREAAKRSGSPSGSR